MTSGRAFHLTSIHFRTTSTSLHQVSIYDYRHLAQRAGARLQRPQPGIDRLDGAADSPADMRHHQPLRRPLHRESHAALEEGLCLVIQGSGFGEVAQYVDMLSTALSQD